MKIGSVLCLALFAASSAFPLAANQTSAASQAATAADKTAPSYDMKAQALEDLKIMQTKIVSLAEATPADKFSWRPSPDVRTIGETYLHIAGANYSIPTMMTGTVPAPGFQAKDYEKTTTDKTKIVDQLNKSFGYAIASVQSMSNADFARAEKKLGPDANSGDVIYLLVTHCHEQLGQAIAYARMNGIVPPWTAEALKKNPKAAQE
jgi:uncharacterized damage-inducible protein DinB